MVTKDEIKNLANLARIEITEEEAEKMTNEVDSILGYVGQITKVSGDSERVIPKWRNVLRDDAPLNKPEEYTEKILKNAPSREDNYLKVKKIL